MTNRTNLRTPSKRGGIAVVELAVCLPILVVVLLGTIEICNAIFLKQTATAAAYEAVKISSGSNGSKVAAELRGNEVLAARGLSNCTIQFQPVNEADWTRGTPIFVDVSIPTSNNMGGISLFYQGQTLTASVAMVKQ